MNSSTRTVSIVRVTPEDDGPEWDVVVEDSADPNFYVEADRHREYGEALREAEVFAAEFDATLRR